MNAKMSATMMMPENGQLQWQAMIMARYDCLLNQGKRNKISTVGLI